MDFFTFMASSAAISSFFYHCARKGAEFKGDNPVKLFESLRPVGMDAEKAMFAATGGVNTHKGLIFSLGIISAAAALCFVEKERTRLDIEELCGKVSEMTQGLCRRELDCIEKKELTHGEAVYLKYGARGIRGEVEDGFPTVRFCSLPLYKKLVSKNTYSLNDVLVETLLHIMSTNEDTNILSRHDMPTLDYVKKYASEAIAAGGMLTQKGKEIVYKMDSDFIQRNISPGGSADLLAVTIMLDLLT